MKAILLEASELLCENLQPSDVLRKLKAKGALKSDDVEKIKRQDTTTEMVEMLLNVLMRKPASAYEKFIEILKVERDDLFVQVTAIELRHGYHKSKLFYFIVAM